MIQIEPLEDIYFASETFETKVFDEKKKDKTAWKVIRIVIIIWVWAMIISAIFISIYIIYYIFYILKTEYSIRKKKENNLKKKYFIYILAIILPTLIILWGILGFCPIDKYIQFYWGKCYYNGIGVTKDESKAVEWYKKVAEQGDKNAKAALQHLSK